MALRTLAGGTQVARHDGYGGRWTNERTGQGLSPARTSWTSYTSPFPLDRSTITSLLRTNGLARRIALREPYDATREGCSLGETEDQRALAQYLRKRGALKWVRRARGWARAFGGAAILLLVDDGRPADQPIDYNAIRAVRGSRVLTRWELAPLTYDWGHRSYQVGDVETWQVSLGHATKTVHRDRLIVFQGVDLPDDELQRDGGWGGSIFDLVWAELRNYQSSLDYVPEFVSLLTQAVFKQKGLAAGVLAGKAEKIAERYEVLVGGLSVLNALALDADAESYDVVQRPVSGLGEVFDLLVTALVAAGEMPRLILLGETPGGLHAGKDAPEVRAWYDHVAAVQPEEYTPPVAQIVDLFARSMHGPTGGRPIDCEVVWLPLYQQTAEEIAALELVRAQRRSLDVAATVVAGGEARRDPDVARLYNLTPEEIALAPASSPAGATEGDFADDLTDAEALLPMVAADPSRMPPGERLISAKDAATRLGYRTAGPIHRLASAGVFPAFRPGGTGQWRFAWSQIEAAVRAHAPAPVLPPAVH
jgi:phage-related protein (TIGR01555 family)